MISSALPLASSMTHQHILAVANTRIAQLRETTDVIRICDMGYGNGHLLGFLAQALPLLNPNLKFEFFGLEVSDSGVQSEGFFDKSVGYLENTAPAIDWNGRLSLVSASDSWPYADDSLHIIVSNQVLEHVFDHKLFFSEVYRTLAVGGYSAHLFPIIHNVWEPHLRIPLVHRINQHQSKIRFIKMMSRLGLGRYRAHRDGLGMSLDTYAEEHADYLSFLTNYKSWGELLALCKQAGLRADYQFTEQYYYCKIRTLLRKPAKVIYPASSVFANFVSKYIFKRVASVTLNTEKRQTYRR
jgi:SAM-dependent methyltransferase